MTVRDRHRYIERAIAAEASVSTIELARALRVSVETIRRDLILLEDQGIVRRVYGGAVAPSRKRSDELPFAQRRAIHSAAKAAVGETAAGLVVCGQSVFVDVGTTCQAVARALARSFRGMIVSHSLLVAGELADAPEIEVLLAPGKLRRGEWSLAGTATHRFLQGMHFDVALMSCGGVDAAAGVTDFNFEDAQIKQTVAKNSKQAFVVADFSKHGVVGTHFVADWYDIHGIITDRPPPEGLVRAVHAAGGELRLPS